jgi:hypothetical protein
VLFKLALAWACRASELVEALRRVDGTVALSFTIAITPSPTITPTPYSDSLTNADTNGQSSTTTATTRSIRSFAVSNRSGGRVISSARPLPGYGGDLLSFGADRSTRVMVLLMNLSITQEQDLKLLFI